METEISREYAPFCRPKFTVLVEEQALVRHLWTEHYQNNGWPLEVFENPLDFLTQLDRFSGRDEKMYFFFDQDFGRVRGVGIQLARAVAGLNSHQTVSLVTNYSPEYFYKEVDDGVIQYVFEKYPKAIFGTGYLDYQFNKNPLLLEFLCADLSERTALEKEMLFFGDRLEFTLEKHFPSAAPKLVPSTLSTVAEIHSVRKPSDSLPWWRRIQIFIGAEA